MRILKITLISLLSLIAVMMLLVYIFDLSYVFKGVRVIYMTGHDTAFLDDYKYFDNHEIGAGTAQPWAEAIGEHRAALSDNMVRFHQEIRSVAYMVILRDSIVAEQYFDGYTASSKSNSFSMSKSIVAVILGKVIETGHIKSIDQKVVDFVPEISGTYASELTIRDLVTMSSGMSWDESYKSPFSITTKAYFYRDLPKAISQLPISDRPGQRFIYQSGDTQLLGIAIQRATGRTLSDLLTEYFWIPMGAEQDALWQVDSEVSGYEKGFCCIAASARDFARFGRLYKQDGRWGDRQLLDSSYVEQSLKPRFEDSPQYGFSWWLGEFQGKSTFRMDGHLGQFVIVIPEDDLIIVRLGHQMDGKKKSDSNSAFQQFIRDAYILVGDRL